MPASAAMNLTGRVDPIAEKVRPVDDAATALFGAADRARHGQPLGLDVAQLEGLLDQGLEVLLRERRGRAAPRSGAPGQERGGRHDEAAERRERLFGFPLRGGAVERACSAGSGPRAARPRGAEVGRVSAGTMLADLRELRVALDRAIRRGRAPDARGPTLGGRSGGLGSTPG